MGIDDIVAIICLLLAIAIAGAHYASVYVPGMVMNLLPF